MAEERVQRRLAAILAADVAGYSRLMGDDEEGTLAALNAHLKDLIEPCIAEHRGRVVKTTGDGLLAEFASVVDAVRCAVAFQEGMQGRNTDTPEERRIEFRIGINLGDVIVQEDDVFGDGVNIAARLEGLAEVGGILISGKVHDEVSGRLNLAFEDLGPQSVKNIDLPVPVWRVVAGDAPERPRRRARNRRTARGAATVALLVVAGVGSWQAGWLGDWGATPVGRAAQFRPTLPGGPSIAVMAFTNLSGDPAQDYFSDGLTEDVIAALGRFSNLTVLARNATLRFNRQARASADIGRELGVRYLLEGSVRRAGSQVRVSAQLIDAATGQHLWSSRYDNEFKDLFSVQDDITRKVVGALAVELTRVESARAANKPPEKLEAYDSALRGWNLLRRPDRSAMFQARELFKRAIAIDAGYAAAYAGLGATHELAVRLGYTEFIEKSIKQAEKLARQALFLDANSVRSRGLLALVYIHKGEFDLAAAQLRRALTINPSDAESYKVYGHVLVYSGHAAKAVEWMEAALRLDPNMGVRRMTQLAIAYYLSGRYKDAVSAAQKAVKRSPKFFLGYAPLAAAYAQLGRTNEAIDTARRLVRLRPFFTIDWFTSAFRDPEDAAHMANGLQKAGLKRSKTRN